MKKLINTCQTIVLLIVIVVNVQAQSGSDCPNLDFSLGNFTNWVCKTSNSQYAASTAYNDLTWTGSVAVNGRHTIMTDIYGYDSNTCNGSPNQQLALVPNGFTQSARVGNMQTMSEADAIIYQMTVDTNNALMLLHFGIVFNDAAHQPAQQPCFEIRIQDANNNLLNVNCNRYFVICDANMPGFITCSSQLRWRDWTTIGVNLFDLMGQTICLVIIAADCSLGSHFGYGYVVGECQPMEVQVQYCEGATEARLEAPDGFVSYVWRGPNGGVVGNTQKLSIQNPSLGLRYSVTMQSTIGCISVLNVKIEKPILDADFTCDSTSHACYPSGVRLTSNATALGAKIESIDWTISKISGVRQTEYYGTDTAFTYFFKDTGYYKILFSVYSESACIDTSSVIVYSQPPIDVRIDAPSLICKNTETEITASGADTYEWIGVKRVQSDSSAIVDKGGVYMVKGTNVLGCAFDTVEIADLEFAIHYTKEDNRCMVDTNGTISITQVVGDYVYPVHHYWEDLGFMNGASLSVREHLPTDTFVVYSIDAIGCFRYDTIPIKEELFLGNIGLIQGESFVQQTGNYTYTVDSVEGAEGYRWWAKALTSNGDVRLLDTRTPYNRILVPIRDANSIQLHVVAFNVCDTSDTSSLFIQNASRISERTASDDLILFPNPTSDQLTIQCNKAVMEEITVVDLVGKVVLKQSIRAKECILDLRPLHKGLYFIRIQCDDALLTEKIIKK